MFTTYLVIGYLKDLRDGLQPDFPLSFLFLAICVDFLLFCQIMILYTGG